ncbi:MAG TPA: hydroxyisourate hydrolase [Planktothrix sp.]|jgi:5-hydroxyisourate hydrolase
MSNRSPITTHVLNTSLGKPGKGIKANLEMLRGDRWEELGRGVTNEDGRIADLLSPEHKLAAGIYRLTFNILHYFESQSIEGFYPYVQIAFEVRDGEQHYHVPLLLNPFGYSTYRGS